MISLIKSKFTTKFFNKNLFWLTRKNLLIINDNPEGENKRCKIKFKLSSKIFDGRI